MHVDSSSNGVVAVDRLTGLLDRFHVGARLIEAGPLRFTNRYDAEAGGHLHVIRSGTVEVVNPAIDGLPRRLRIERPSVILYAAPVTHQLVPVDRSEVACAALEMARGADHPLARALPPIVVVPLDRVPGLQGALALLFAEIDHVRCGHRQLAGRLLEVVVIQLLRWLLDHPQEAGVHEGLVAGMADARIAGALVAIHADPGRAWTVDTMAAQAAMSRSAFAALFRTLVGVTPAAYVADWRVLLAQTRLRAGEPATAFARELGFASPSGFSRAFTQRTGRSPSAWVRSASADGAVSVRPAAPSP